MNPNGATPQSMLPPQAVASMIRSGGTPGQLFQQNPMAQNQLPGSAGYDPSLQQQPAGGQPMPQAAPPVAPNGQTAAPQMSEAEMILKALTDRLSHHSKITEKTINTIASQIEANQAVQQPQGQPTA